MGLSRHFARRVKPTRKQVREARLARLDELLMRARTVEQLDALTAAAIKAGRSDEVRRIAEYRAELAAEVAGKGAES